MDLRQIRYFVATAEAGSMLSAAERLHVAQPALSRRLRDLETGLGAVLFDRHARGIRLTPEGSRFLGHARDILAACARAETAFPSHRPTDRAARIAFGVTPTPAALLMPHIIAACGAFVPPIELLVRQGSTPELHDLIARRIVDGTLTYAAQHGDGVEVHPLYRENLLLVGRPDRLGGSGDIRFADLAGRPLILDPRTHVTRAVIDQAARQTHVALDVRAEIEPVPIKRQMLMTQDVATIAIVGAFAEDIARKTLAARRIVAPELPMVLNLVLQGTLDARTKSFFCRVVGEAVADVDRTLSLGWRVPVTASR